MNYVLDCSFCSAVFLPDEMSDKVFKAFNKINEDDLIFIPQLWWYEIGNVLTTAVKRKRLMHSDVINIIRLFKEYGFSTDVSYGDKYVESLFELSQLYKLTAYDSAYLELAIRKNCSFGTLDKDLHKAAKTAGLKILP